MSMPQWHAEEGPNGKAYLRIVIINSRNHHAARTTPCYTW